MICLYRIDVLERSLSYEEVAEIFARVNSLGAKLRSSDSAMAQITAQWRDSLNIFEKSQEECAGIEQLSLPREATIDLYVNKPLRLKKTDRGWIVYSVGIKGIDNDGKLEIQGNEGFAPTYNPQE